MKWSKAPLGGVYVIEIEPIHDERGFFARSYCADELRRHGITMSVAQSSVSFNRAKGTLRGMHFQAAPHEEEKLVRCTAGAVFDVIVDLRPGSDSFGRWFATELTSENHRALFIPKGFAHGFLTQADESEVLYYMSVPYAPGYGRGFRWDDPEVGIVWPARPSVIAPRDAAFPNLRNCVRP